MVLEPISVDARGKVFRTFGRMAVGAALLAFLTAPAWAHPLRPATPHHAPRTAHAPSVAKYLQVEAAKKRVVITLVAGAAGPGGQFSFDGYGKGQLVVTVPVGWTVTVDFRNAASLPHSVVVVPWSAGLNLTSPHPAFPGATTPDPTTGTAPGSSAHFTFRATRLGKYRLLCAVPGHAALGMWDTLVVAKAKTASIRA